MVFVWIAIAVAILEMWAVASGGHSEPGLPLIARVLGPLALAASAFRRKGLERVAVVLSAILIALLINARSLGNQWLVSVSIGLCALILGLVGLRSRNELAATSPRIVGIAFAVAALTYFGLIQWFTK